MKTRHQSCPFLLNAQGKTMYQKGREGKKVGGKEREEGREREREAGTPPFSGLM